MSWDQLQCATLQWGTSIMGQITATRNLVATKVVRHGGQWMNEWNSLPTMKYLKHSQSPCLVNSLILGKFELYFRYLIFQIISVIDGWGISCELAHRWMSLKLTDERSTLVQVMAWCHQAASHCLSQWWPRSLSPYGITRPQWVKKKRI